MASIKIRNILREEIEKIGLGWDIKGVIDSNKRVYTITNDTKLISKVLELVTAPLILEIASHHHLKVVQSDRQTVYPDFTLIFPDSTKIALDVKSTYRKSGNRVAGFTLGSYTGYLRNPTKNIMFPYHEYKEHWVLGFIYSREDNIEANIVSLHDLDNVIPTIKDIEIIIWEKYRIASDRPGSGNTTNIGSATGIEVLRRGQGIFVKYGVEVFEDYWRNFVQRKAALDTGIEQPYRNVEEYFKWGKQKKV